MAAVTRMCAVDWSCYAQLLTCRRRETDEGKERNEGKTTDPFRHVGCRARWIPSKPCMLWVENVCRWLNAANAQASQVVQKQG